jgi:inorganic pyrophosphatase
MSRFWQYLDQLLASNRIVIDRPKGTAHPRYPDFIYPYDYGYLEGTSASDGSGIDIWLGSCPDRRLVAVIGTVDLNKRDTELKLLVGCTPQEMQDILAVHNDHMNYQAGTLIKRQDSD